MKGWDIESDMGLIPAPFRVFCGRVGDMKGWDIESDMV
jgi:hypothetical protein